MKVEVIKKWSEAVNSFYYEVQKDGYEVSRSIDLEKSKEHAKQIIDTFKNGFPPPVTIFSEEINLTPKP